MAACALAKAAIKVNGLQAEVSTMRVKVRRQTEYRRALSKTAGGWQRVGVFFLPS